MQNTLTVNPEFQKLYPVGEKYFSEIATLWFDICLFRYKYTDGLTRRFQIQVYQTHHSFVYARIKPSYEA